MKLKRKYIFLSSINYINFLFLLFHFLFKYIYSECIDCPNGEHCSQDCRKSIYADNYFLCDSISSSSSKYYYIRSKDKASDGSCHPTDKCPDKVVYKTNECTPDCDNLIEVGDYCFYEDDLDLDKYEDIINTSTVKKNVKIIHMWYL